MRDIERVFLAEDFETVPDYENMESGMRRSPVAGYLAGINRGTARRA